MGKRTKVLGLVGLAAIAIAPAARAADCVPGQQSVCGCSGGSGTQVCAADGTHYEACICEARQPLVIAPMGYQLRPARGPRQDSKMFGWGLASLFVGIAGSVGGIALLGVGAANGENGGGLVWGGLITLLSSQGFIGFGIPLTAVGGQRQKLDTMGKHWWVPSKIGVSPTGGTLAWAL